MQATEQATTAPVAAAVQGVVSFYRHSLTQSLLADKLTLASAVFVLLVIVAAVFAPIVAPYPGDGTGEKVDLRLRHLPPWSTDVVDGEDTFPGESRRYILGTDHLGRDMLSRIIYGARISLMLGFGGVILSGAIGVVLGLVAGYYRGFLDDVIMRGVDMMLAIPSLMIALLILYYLGASFKSLILVFALLGWESFCRVARGVVLSLREQPFVDSARAIGSSDLRVLMGYMLPNMVAPLMAMVALGVPARIITESSLSFLGFGIQPPESSWGLMLAQGKPYMLTAWWSVVVPGMAIFLTVLCANLFGVWLRAVNDPLQRWQYLRVSKETREAGVGV